jgi:uncharacterized membrane protein
MQNPDEMKQWAKQLGRMRVSAFFFGLSVVAFIPVINEESDIFSHVLDDYLIIGISVVAIIVLAMMWKKQEMPQLRRTNNILFVLAVVALAIAFMALAIESGDSTDVADDIPKLIFSIFLIVNRFV